MRPFCSEDTWSTREETQQVRVPERCSSSAMNDVTVLEREQRRLSSARPPLWQPRPGPIIAGGLFVAFARGEQGPGRAGDRAHVGAAATRDTTELARVTVEGRAGAAYVPGLLAAREGAMLEAGIRALQAEGLTLDVLLIDATGRDHPRGVGLALHLGAVLDIPTVGVTHRPLLASGPEPNDRAGASTDLVLDGVVVGRWLRTQQGVRPVAVHAAWRTDDQHGRRGRTARDGDGEDPGAPSPGPHGSTRGPLRCHPPPRSDTRVGPLSSSPRRAFRVLRLCSHGITGRRMADGQTRRPHAVQRDPQL